MGLTAASKPDAKKVAKLMKEIQQLDNDKCTLSASASAEVEPPPRKRFIVNDATVAAMEGILRDNPNGVMVYRDELSGWLAGLEDPRREDDRGFWLECWAGNEGGSSDRVGRGETTIENKVVSVFGGIQPQKLRQLLVNSHHDDGMVQRFHY